MELEHMIHGDMPGDRIAIEQGHVDKAEKIYPVLRELLGVPEETLAQAGSFSVTDE